MKEKRINNKLKQIGISKADDAKYKDLFLNQFVFALLVSNYLIISIQFVETIVIGQPSLSNSLHCVVTSIDIPRNYILSSQYYCISYHDENIRNKVSRVVFYVSLMLTMRIK